MPYLPGQRPPVSRPKRIRERPARTPVSYAPSVADQLAALSARLTRLERGVRWAITKHLLQVKGKGLDQ